MRRPTNSHLDCESVYIFLLCCFSTICDVPPTNLSSSPTPTPRDPHQLRSIDVMHPFLSSVAWNIGPRIHKQGSKMGNDQGFSTRLCGTLHLQNTYFRVYQRPAPWPIIDTYIIRERWLILWTWPLAWQEWISGSVIFLYVYERTSRYTNIHQVKPPCSINLQCHFGVGNISFLLRFSRVRISE